MSDPRDKEFLEALIKRANEGIEARKALQFYYPGVVEIVTVDGHKHVIDDSWFANTDVAKEYRLKGGLNVQDRDTTGN